MVLQSFQDFRFLARDSEFRHPHVVIQGGHHRTPYSLLPRWICFFCILYPCISEVLCSFKLLPRIWTLRNILLSNLQFCPSLQWRKIPRPFVRMALSKSNISFKKDCQNCFNTCSLANLALALSWSLRLVLTLPHLTEQFKTLVLQYRAPEAIAVTCWPLLEPQGVSCHTRVSWHTPDKRASGPLRSSKEGCSVRSANSQGF